MFYNFHKFFHNSLGVGLLQVYYVHNYIAQHSILTITGGRLSSSQTDIDQDGILLQPVVLEKLASFDLNCDNSWNRAARDSLRVNLEISVMEHDIGIVSNVKNIDHDYILYIDSIII